MKKRTKITCGPPGRACPTLFIPLTILSLSLFSCGLEPKLEKKNLRMIPKEKADGQFILAMSSSASLADSESIKTDVARRIKCDKIDLSELKMSDSAMQSGLFDKQLLLNFSGCLAESGKELESTVLDELGKNDSIKSIEANAHFKATGFTENDPLKLDQYYLRHIRRDKACETLQNNSLRQRPVVIAVLDTGVVKDHPDLKNAFYQTEHGRIIGANFVGKGPYGEPDENWTDLQGHGTHVAGIIAAESNNHEGTTGVASCQNIKIMPVKVLGDKGVGSSVEIQRGIDFAIENGANIINLSLGSNQSTSSQSLDFRSPIYDYAMRKGVIVIAASGNDGLVNGSIDRNGRRVYGFPASYAGVISVAATDHLGKLTNFSNRGPLVDVAAPGYAIIAPYIGGYKRLSGTSMATPAVSAAVGLSLSKLSPVADIDPLAFEKILLKSVRSSSLNENDVKSQGVIDALDLIEKVN